jgi:DNA-binding NarL/FixJ family response regulator
MRGTPESALTPKERAVLVLVARGLTNQEIAQQIRTSTGKVKTAMYRACARLEATNRIEAVFVAIRRGMLTVHEIFSIDELADMLSSLKPETVEAIAKLLRHNPHNDSLSTQSENDPQNVKRPDTILTQRERDVLALVARGLTNQEIAEQLCTSVSTVRSFLYQACAKLEARNREQAFILAIKKRAIRVSDVFSLGELVELLASVEPEIIEQVAQLLRQRLSTSAFPQVDNRFPLPKNQIKVG